MKIIFTIFFIFLTLNSLFAQETAKKGNDWAVLLKQGKVEFLVKHQLSSFDQRHNTLFRLKNTTNHELTVTFKPAFLCENSEGFIEMSEVKVTLYPKQSATLLAFRPCYGAVPNQIKLFNIKIKER
jgi:hypothetical protein